MYIDRDSVEKCELKLGKPCKIRGIFNIWKFQI